VQNHHLAVKYHQLVPHEEFSLTDKVSLHDNLVIEGDNLKVLKALLPTYAGKIKCIYIDPPYNTGNEAWAYNDNVNSPMMQEWLGKTVDKEDLTRHDKWLCMMLPRLKLLHELLSEDGVIFISIDEIEHHYLMCLMDEVFGKDNLLGNLIWKSRQIVDSRNQNKISVDHEYIVSFGKSATATLRGKKSDESKYSNPDKDPRGPWMSNTILGLANELGRPNLHYKITDPKTGKAYDCPPDTGWRYSKETMQSKINEGRIIFPKKDGGRPREKKYLNELSDEFTGFSTLLNENVGFTLNGTRDLREIFEEELFAFPKPRTLIKVLLEQATNNNDIILDSFAGSATTAQAVFELNKEDRGNRKFILVETESYANTITAERMRRVIKGVPGSKNQQLKDGLGGTFSYFKLGDPIEMENLLKGENLPSYTEFARYLFYTATGEQFTETEINRQTGFIGESSSHEVYLFYKPDLEWLKQNALTLNMVNELPAYKGKSRLIFAPVKYVDDETCSAHHIKFCQLPYEIYRMKK